MQHVGALETREVRQGSIAYLIRDAQWQKLTFPMTEFCPRGRLRSHSHSRGQKRKGRRPATRWASTRRQ